MRGRVVEKARRPRVETVRVASILAKIPVSSAEVEVDTGRYSCLMS